MTRYNDRREFTRVGVQLDGKLSWQESAVQVESRDVSMKGVFLACDNPPPVGTDCRIKFALGEPESQLGIDILGKIVRVDERGVGVEFIEILGLRSYDHLRNLVLYNSSDNTEQVEQEFSSHLGIKRRV
ncbi:MAG: PilZ domain-containing protein [bacterium]|nr:PilZ domain-containing protein [bacterium]